MLDLKELESRLDNALANETTDSLNNWLNQQRIESITNFYGEGNVSSMDTETVCYTRTAAVTNNITDSSDKVSGDKNKYRLAA